MLSKWLDYSLVLSKLAIGRDQIFLELTPLIYAIIKMVSFGILCAKYFFPINELSVIFHPPLIKKI